MIGYLKLKSQNEELYETDYLNKLKQKETKLYKIAYFICYCFYEIIVSLKYMGNMITVKQIYHAYLFIFPFNLEQKVSKRKIQKCMKKTKRLMQKYHVQTLVLSEEVKKIYKFQFNNSQIERRVHILNGKGLMPYLIKEILEYILNKQNTKTQLEDLYLCMKEPQSIYLENIAYLANFFRSINIITPNINQFQKMADKIEEKHHVMITVTNNKRKSLQKAKFVINFDFNEQEIKKYTIYRRAIIISLESSGIYGYTGFEGIQIRKIGIDTSDEIKDYFKKYNLLSNCSLTTLYESLVNEKIGFAQVKAQMKKDEIRVVKLYGMRGEIESREYLKMAN